jgi:hypothetical protein
LLIVDFKNGQLLFCLFLFSFFLFLVTMIMHYRSKRTLLVSFITAIAVANVSGPQYVYPTFGTALTTRFHWSVIENSIVSFATFMGLSFSGPFCAWMIETYGFQRYKK